MAGSDSPGVRQHLTSGARHLPPPAEAGGDAWVRLDRVASPFAPPVAAAAPAAALQEAAAGHLARELSLRLQAEDIAIGPGSREWLLALQLAYGGELMIPVPGPESYRRQAQALGRPVRPLPTYAVEGWRVDPQTLERACRHGSGARLLLLQDLCDPTGSSYSDEQVQDLAAVARRHRLLVVADHGYTPLHFGRTASIARYYPEGTLVLLSPERWLAGAPAAPMAWPPELDWLRRPATQLLAHVARPTQAAAQRATAPLLRGESGVEAQLEAMRRILQALVHYAAERLGLAGLHVVEPEGGFVLFADFEPLREPLERAGIEGAEALSRRIAQETGVVASPGTRFGGEPGDLTQRYALTAFDGAAALGAALEQPPGEELGEAFVERYCAPTAAAITAVARWLDRVAPRRRSTVGAAETPPGQTRTYDGLPAVTPRPPSS